jgi:L-cystine transport system permease protein
MQTIVRFLPYLLIVIKVLLYSVGCGLILGSLLAWAKLSKNRVLRGLAYAYTTLIRCTPAVILLLLLYYGIPLLLNLLLGVKITNASKELFLIISMALFCGASMSEALRAAYTAISSNQFEAAISVGMTDFQAFRRVLLPQVVFVVLPPMANIIVSTLKEGSLGFTIGFIDLIGRANVLNGNTLGNYLLEIYISAALFYWVLSGTIIAGIRSLERIFGKHKITY